MSFFSTVPDGPRLLCLPPAGGGTSDFVRWTPRWPVLVPCLPGRERRLRERPYRAMAPLVEDLIEALPLDEPFAIYGHSMGSWIGFALCRELRRQGAPLPEHLIVAARHAPDREERDPALGRLPRAEFLERMQARYGAIPAVLLDDRELLDTFLPALRGDVVLLDDYHCAPEPALPVPITVLYGEDDATVTRADAEGWSRHTSQAFAMEAVPGGHFFHREPGFESTLDAIPI